MKSYGAERSQTALKSSQTVYTCVSQSKLSSERILGTQLCLLWDFLLNFSLIRAHGCSPTPPKPPKRPALVKKWPAFSPAYAVFVTRPENWQP